jgi:hypothetical protein
MMKTVNTPETSVSFYDSVRFCLKASSVENVCGMLPSFVLLGVCTLSYRHKTVKMSCSLVVLRSCAEGAGSWSAVIQGLFLTGIQLESQTRATGNFSKPCDGSFILQYHIPSWAFRIPQSTCRWFHGAAHVMKRKTERVWIDSLMPSAQLSLLLGI